MSYISFQPSDHFNTVLHTGANKTVSVGFEPSFSWVKERDAAGHALFDAVRGATKLLESNSTNAQATLSDSLTSFTSDGFVLGADSGGYVGGSSQATVSWNWRGNGAGSSNTNGSITSTVSANTTSGFSIVKWTGTASAGTIGHGLGVAPKVVLVKRYSTSGGGWLMQHGDLTGATYVIKLSTTGAEENDGANFNSAFPTSSVFSVYNSNNTNKSGDLHIAYCFAEKKGFSKFGSYTGNGNADGAFVYTGFKPAMVLFKQSSASGEKWYIYDNKRNAFNITNSVLFPNASDAESSATTGAPIDMLSNGFKLKGTDAAGNGSGSTYIFMAFAEEPLVSSNGVPAVAR